MAPDEPAVPDIASIISALGSAVTSDDVVRILDDSAKSIVAHDLAHRLIPAAAKFADVDFGAHPWAALPAAIALVQFDRPRGWAVLGAARATFERNDDREGCGWACFVEGLESLGEGDLLRADTCWANSIEALGESHLLVRFSALHRSLGAYERGDLDGAVRLAEYSLHRARRDRDSRMIAAAATELAFFRFWKGDFPAVMRAADAAEHAFAEIGDPLDRYEEPLMWAARSAVAYVRGDYTDGDDLIDRGLDAADAMRNAWYRAILLTLRADLSASWNPLRSIDDARAALGYYDEIGEQWWSRWALQALVIAQRENGDVAAALAGAAALLGWVSNPLERGRAMLERGLTEIAVGDKAAAKGSLVEALDLLDSGGARWHAARAVIGLSHADPQRGEYLVRTARSRAGADANEIGWRRMLRGASFELRLLGRADMTVSGQLVEIRGRTTAEAMCLLVDAGAAGLRVETLCEALWPGVDLERARNRCNVLIASIRREIQPAVRIIRKQGRIIFDLDEGECDLLKARAVAQAAIRSGVPVADEEWARAALEMPVIGGSTNDSVLEIQYEMDALAARLATRNT